MNVFLNRNSNVPLHDQLCAQIGQLVASGSLAEGVRLPSVRGLAHRLGIHHNTVQAAYKELAARGVLQIRQGSGVQVAPLSLRERDALSGGLEALAAEFVAAARARGHDTASIQAACARALAPVPVRRLIVVNPHPDLQQIYQHELADRLDLPMAGMAVAELPALPEALRAESCFLTSMNHATGVKQVLGSGGKLVIFRLASIEPLLAQVRALPADAAVALVSASSRFLFLMAELLSGVLEAERLLSVPFSETARLQRVGKLVSLLITDSASLGRLPGGRAPVQVFRLMADDVFPALAQVLPAGAFRAN